jgi:drug/metabolite transporter (DMT)-like permease
LKAREQQFIDPERGPVLTARFVVALLMMVVGIAWVVYFYIGVRADPSAFDAKTGKPEGPSGIGFMGDLEHWNYLIGFGLFFLGLAISAHPSTPLGRGRGVVGGMLTCFLVGLAWICLYYVMSGQPWQDDVPVLNDLGQYNLMVGICFMAVGFTFATRWE